MVNKFENQDKSLIDLREIIKKIIIKKKTFYKVLSIVFVLSCIYILCVPRYYTSETKLAPEMSSPLPGGTLGDIASTFGINLDNMQSSDAITPLIYPDLMEDNKFVSNLFTIKVINEEGDINTNYYDYLKNKQKHSWWIYPIRWIKKHFKFKKEKVNKVQFDPYNMSKSQDEIAEIVRKNITLNVDKKTGIITIETKAQDPLIAKTLADSTRTKLQSFITDYRTNKVRIDLEYYNKLAHDALKEYVLARKKYADFSDANTDVILESVRAKQNDLENDMQLKYNTYTTMMTQYQAAKAKVQERTPAFTIIKGASVAIKPAGPKRIIFVIGMSFFAFIVTVFYILKDDFKHLLVNK